MHFGGSNIVSHLTDFTNRSHVSLIHSDENSFKISTHYHQNVILLRRTFNFKDNNGMGSRYNFADRDLNYFMSDKLFECDDFVDGELMKGYLQCCAL